MGVWIETLDTACTVKNRCVTPYVGVWIETKIDPEDFTLEKVTPYVGVWIETYRNMSEKRADGVTPYVGVWIETPISSYICNASRSHPTWVCGLKLTICSPPITV